jgi:hypothetical protein
MTISDPLMPTPAELARRASLLERVESLYAQNPQCDLSEICAAVGITRPTFYRWKAAQGKAPVEDGRPGRPAKFSLSDEEARALRHWCLRTRSLELAIEQFVRDEACQPGTAAAIGKMMDDAAARRLPRVPWPHSLRRAARPSEDEAGLFRGPKAFQKFELSRRREMTWRDAAGAVHALLAGDMYESDDFSGNEDFRYTDPMDGQEKLGRQTLATQDVYALKFLAFHAIGRPRDAYRVEDIADHMREVVEAIGLPLFWRLEQGLWDSNFVHGIETTYGDAWGGLGELFHVINVHKPRQKGGLEGSFDLLQALMAHMSTSRGRERGEFEEQTKQAMRAKRGMKDALDQFWSIDQYMEGLLDASLKFNQRPKNRVALGDGCVPDELWADTFRTKRECPAEQMWRFCPIKKEAVVRSGQIQISADHYPRPFFFRVNGDDLATAEGFRYLPHGFRVLVAFHPAHPEAGAHIFCGDRSELNREGWQYAQKLVTAAYVAPVPQVDLSGQADYSHQRKANAAVRSEFREVKRAGGAGKRVSTARDGMGAALHVARGASAAPKPMVEELDLSDGPMRTPRTPRITKPAVDIEALRRREAALADPLAATDG